MAKQFRTITNIKLFRNDSGTASHGNSKWTPYKDGSASDITFHGNRTYSVKLFDNGDGSLGLNISEVTENDGSEHGVGMKQLGDTIKTPTQSGISLDDDIPF